MRGQQDSETSVLHPAEGLGACKLGCQELDDKEDHS